MLGAARALERALSLDYVTRTSDAASVRACRQLLLMACARLAAAFITALAVAAPVRSPRCPLPPRTNLRAFALRADAPVTHTFTARPRSLVPVPGAKTYQFELSTSRGSRDNGIVWSTKGLTTPAVSIPVSLPWITGNPYSLYAHVRAITARARQAGARRSASTCAGRRCPTPITPAYPGLLRWSAVPGANAYMLWLVDAGKVFTTRSNMADEREYYTLHQGAAYSSVVHWRVRPMRWLYGQTDNGIPSVSYGPWSPIYTSYNPPFQAGPVTALETVSTSSPTRGMRLARSDAGLHLPGEHLDLEHTEELYRVEVFTDEDCLNTVFRGAMTGAPAYVPRATGPLGAARPT